MRNAALLFKIQVDSCAGYVIIPHALMLCWHVLLVDKIIFILLLSGS